MATGIPAWVRVRSEHRLFVPVPRLHRGEEEQCRLAVSGRGAGVVRRAVADPPRSGGPQGVASGSVEPVEQVLPRPRPRVCGVDRWYLHLCRKGCRRLSLQPSQAPLSASTLPLHGGPASDALLASLYPGVVPALEGNQAPGVGDGPLLPRHQRRQLRPARSGEEGRPEVALPAPGREAARTRASPGR